VAKSILIWRKFSGKIEILSTLNVVCQKFAAVCSKMATSCSSYFFNARLLCNCWCCCGCRRLQ